MRKFHKSSLFLFFIFLSVSSYATHIDDCEVLVTENEDCIEFDDGCYDIQPTSQMMDPLVVSLLCPATPGSEGFAEETVDVTVGATVGTGAGSITFPSGIYSTIPANAIDVNVALTTELEAFGASWLSELTINIAAPGTFADGTSQPSNTNGNGTETYTTDYGDNDPTGLWDFTIVDSSNDPGVDAEVTFTLTLTWTVPPVPSDCDTIICNANSFVIDSELPGLTYNWSTGGTTQSITVTESGTYTVTVTDGTETAVDDVTVLFGDASVTNDVSICDGQTYTVGTSVYNTTGNYQDVFTSYLGCDSIVNTNLVVGSAGTTDIFPTICDGESFTIGSSTYNSSGVYTDVLTSSQGCDSTVQTNLTVLAPIETTENVSICDGDSYSVGSSTYTTSGTYSDILTSYLGCDSTVQTILDVIPSTFTDEDVVICFGESYTIGTSTYNTTGNYSDLLENSIGCDSTVNTNLIVLDEITSTQDITICFGDEYTIAGSVYDADGTYTDVLTSYQGCDSTVTTNLTVLPENFTEDFVQICTGESYTVGTSTYNTTGDFTDVLTSYQGCDSTILTHLTVVTEITEELFVTICDGETYEVGMSSYDTSGDYVDMLTSNSGCDSTVTLHLTVAPNVIFDQSPILCFGDTLFVGDNEYTTSGSFTDVLTTYQGCDSTVNTTLTILDEIMVENTFELCAGESVSVGDNVYDVTGNYTDTLESVNGCDSTVMTFLTVLDEIIEDLDIEICPGQSVTVGTSVYDSPGSYTDVLMAGNGCDSTVNLTLTFSPPIETTNEVQICAGQTYMEGDSEYTQNGTYTDMYTTPEGCDSTVTTILTVVAQIEVTDDISICDGESYSIGMSNYTATGTYTDVLIASGGCDSVVTTNLTVISGLGSTQDVSICFGETYSIGGSNYTEEGVYTDVIPSVIGCDSTVVTNLTVIGNSPFDNQVQICEGDTYSIGDSNYTLPGTYTDVLESSLGCDSTVITTLEVVVTINTEETILLCEGDEYEGVTYNESTTIINEGISLNGCDSIHTIDIIVSVGLEVEMIIQDDICETGEGSATAAVFGGIPPYTYEWSTGNTTAFLNNVSMGAYIVTVTDANGCTTTGTGNVETTPNISVNFSVQDISCNGENDGVINIDIVTGTPPYQIFWNGPNNYLSNDEDINNLVAGQYTLIIYDASGCGFGTSVTVEEAAALDVEVVTLPGVAYAVTTGGTAPYEYFWSNGSTEPSLLDIDPGNYVVTVEDANGCVVVAEGLVQFATQVQEIDGLVDFNVMPNPSQGQFLVDIEMESYTEMNVQIVNMNGQSVLQDQWQGQSIRGTIDLTQHPVGTYLMIIDNGQQRKVEKLLVVR